MPVISDKPAKRPIVLLPVGNGECHYPQEINNQLIRNRKKLIQFLSESPHASKIIDYVVMTDPLMLAFDPLHTSAEDLALIRRLAELNHVFHIYIDPKDQMPEKHIAPETILKFSEDRQLLDFLESTTSAVLCKVNGQKDIAERLADGLDQPLVPREEIFNELSALPKHRLIIQKANFDVFLVKAQDIPLSISEIGRLRELTFREVGEGTGEMVDTDEFDTYYYQLLIYDRIEKRIVGGYRVAYGAEIFKHFGIDGFYIHKLFNIEPEFYPYMKQAIELGRSYIVKEYQKHRLPLFLLWKGILHFLINHPDIKYIYGPVSISKYYSDLSKGFIIEFLKLHYYNEHLAKYITPRMAFQPRFASINYQELVSNMEGEIRELDRFIEQIDPHFFKIPVLMRQYIRQNAKFVGFNVDPNFSDALDGFMWLDMKHLPKSTIEALNNI